MKINKVAFQAEGFILFHMVLCFSAARILGGKQGKIGFEIESHSPFLINRELTMDEKLKLKGHRIIGHEDPDGKWFLGVDSTPPYGPILDFEYDLLVPLEGGKVADAAQGLVNDIVEIDYQDTFEIEGSPKNPWKKWFKRQRWPWGPQVTAPMPMAAIQEYMRRTTQGRQAPLITPYTHYRRNYLFVTRRWFHSRFFQKLAKGREPDWWVTDDVLGFLSVALAVAKGAQRLRGWDLEVGVKSLMAIMPRNDWVTVFQQVQTKFPAKLWDVMNHLACFENSGPMKYDITVDSRYCSGDLDDPRPTGDFAKQSWEMLADVRGRKLMGALSKNQTQLVEREFDYLLKDFKYEVPEDLDEETQTEVDDVLRAAAEDRIRQITELRSLSVKAWIDSLDSGIERRYHDEDDDTPDLLTIFDRNSDGQVGAWGRKLEHGMKQDRLLSVWEFRDLGHHSTHLLIPKLVRIEKQIIDLHERYT